MQMSSRNPPITRLLRALSWIEVFVLAGASVLLLVLPSEARAQWPWPLTPFNAMFMGVIYASALIAVANMARVGRWAPARPVLVFIFTFTLVVFVVSLLYVNRFDFQKWLTWAWFALYFILPVNSAYHLWLYRKRPPAEAAPVASTWRIVLLAMSAALGAYGLGLLLAPALFGGFWPWALDAFHGQLYSATFLAGAAGLYAVSRVAARVERETVALAQVSFSAFAILGLILVDASVHRVDWSLPGTWLWIGALGWGVIVGAAMLMSARRMSVAR
ncbi:MAG TPA: hypothetical protein VIK33_18920 [Anaerolineae bacterium]